MKPGIFLLIFFISMSAGAFTAFDYRPSEGDGLSDERPLRVLTSEEILGTTSIPQRRAWARQDLEGETLTTNFANWMTCYSSVNAGNATAESCQCNATGEPLGSISQLMGGIRSCLPDFNDVELVYSKALTDSQKNNRDQLLCACLEQRNSIEFLLSSSDISDRERRRALRVARDRNRARNDDERLSRAFGENLGPAITVMNYARSSEEGENLAGIYLGRNRISERDREALARIVENNSNLTDAQCVPQREFIFNKQFPNEPVFYNDLNMPFNADEWNYGVLANRLRTFATTEALKNNEEATRIRIRMEFLHNNPAFKALFMSTDQNSGRNKAALHQILQRHLPRPNCPDVSIGLSCFRNQEWRRQIPNFQGEISAFLGRRDVNDDILNGVQQARALSARALGSVPTSDLEMVNPLSATYNDWTTFCQLMRATPVPLDANPLLTEIERNAVDFTNIAENPEFIEMNENYCTVARQNTARNSQMTFAAYRQRNCDDDNRRDCLARFVREFPLSTNVIHGLVFDMNDLITDQRIIAQSRAGASTNIANIGQSSTARSRSFRTLASIPADYRPGQTLASASASPSGVSRAQVSAQQGQSQQNFNSAGAGSPILPDIASASGTAIPQRQAESARVQELRENKDESQSRVSALNDELTALRNQITETRSRNSQDTTLASLRSRESFLEQQFRKAEAQLAQDRQRFEEERSRTVSSDEDDEEGEPNTSRRSRRIASGSSEGGAVSAGPSGVQSGSSQVASSAAPVSGVAALSPSESSSSARGRQVSGSAIGTQTANGANAGNGEQASSAITVASTTSAEYDQIRSEAAANQIVETLSPEIISQISGGDVSFLEQYRERIEAFPGKYVLLELQATGQAEQIEFVVMKGEGDQLSLASRNGRFIASIPQAIPAQPRVHELERLRENVTSGGR